MRIVFALVLMASAALAQEQAPVAAPLTLDAAVKTAMERNPDLLRQRIQALSSEQDRILAQSAILPRVDFNAGYGRTRTQTAAGSRVIQGVGEVPVLEAINASNQWNAGLRIQQLVFDGGKWWNNLEAAQLGLEANHASVDEQRLQITYLVEQRFYELVRAQRQLAVLGDAAVRSRDQADFVQRLFEGGRSTQADVYQARANRDNDEISRLGQERNVELSRADLALAVGIDPGEPLSVAEPPGMMVEPSQPPRAQEAVQKALTSRPSLKAFGLVAASNRKTVSAARGDYWPQISLGASYGRNTDQFGQFDDPNPLHSSQIAGSVNLNWNLFAGLSTDANVRKAEYQVALAENDLASGRRNVASDVEKAVAQLGTARAQARVATQTLGTATEGLRLARTRQQVGVGTQLEVRDAELKLTQAQLSQVGAMVDGREAEAALRRAQGS